MTKSGPPTSLAPSEYEAIEQAMMETARGRWFLTQFAEKNRREDTQVVLEAISKLESMVNHSRSQPEADRIKKDLVDMSKAIERTRHEIANLKLPEQEDGDNLLEATEELDAIVSATEKATTQILQAAEDVQEQAWIIREDGKHDVQCARIDNDITDIYTACSFQDITGQRTQKVVQILRYLEARINAIVSIWGLDKEEHSTDGANGTVDDKRPDAHLLNGPQLDEDALKQNDIDGLIEEKTSAEEETKNEEEQEQFVEGRESEFDTTANFIAQAAQEVETLTIKAVEVAEDLIQTAEDISTSSDDPEIQVTESETEQLETSSEIISDPEQDQIVADSETGTIVVEDENNTLDTHSVDTKAKPTEIISSEAEQDQDSESLAKSEHPVAETDNIHSEESEHAGEYSNPDNTEIADTIEKQLSDLTDSNDDNKIEVSSDGDLPTPTITVSHIDPIDPKLELELENIVSDDDTIIEKPDSLAQHFAEVIDGPQDTQEDEQPEVTQLKEAKEILSEAQSATSDLDEDAPSIPTDTNSLETEEQTDNEKHQESSPEYQTSDWVGKNLALLEDEEDSDSTDDDTGIANSVRKLSPANKAAMFE